MPTYQYSCTDCDHAFDQAQSFSEDSLTVCPECEGRLRKIFNAVGVVFKGSGFYRTDNRAENRAEAKSKSEANKSETKSEAKSETKSETKPDKSESKSESKPPTKSDSPASKGSSSSKAEAGAA